MTNYSFENEKELLLLVASGNEFAFRRLFNLHHQKPGANIYRITNHQELAEEFVQDVFLKIRINRKALLCAGFRAGLKTIKLLYATNKIKLI